MRVRRVLAVLGLALALGLARAAGDPTEADRAFDAGENERALGLYDALLAQDPDDAHALVRSGMLLSWSKHYDEAIARYDRVLARDPRNAKARLERAKVSLWSKRYEEARKGFQAILADDPADRDARLSLARAYSWDGKQPEARAEYQRVLDAAPSDPEALLGVAQTYAWSGEGDKARPYYERALAAKPGMKEAEIGLAYLDLAAGDTSAARTRSRALMQSDPTDPDVVALDRAVARARAPWIAVGYDHIDDTDENRFDTWRLEGGFGLPARMDLRFGLTASDLDGPVPAGGFGEGTALTLYGVLGWQPKPRHRGELRLGAARLTDSGNETRTTAIGGVSYLFPIGSWNARAAIQRDPFLYSPGILDNDVDTTTVSFRASGHAARRVIVEAGAAYGDLSDGNSRILADAGAWYVFTFSRNALEVGGLARTLDYSENLDHGYFDPSGLVAALASVRSRGNLGGSVWTYDAYAEAGAQSYTFDGATTRHEPLVDVYATFGRPLPHGIGFEVYAGWSNSSTAAGPGFRSLSYGARFRFTIGG